mgnify:CR=1 FL=1
MNILWITNILLPPIAEALNQTKFNFGGWMLSSANQLKVIDGVNLTIASVSNCDNIIKKTIEGIDYYVLPNEKYCNSDKSLGDYWQQVREEVNPEVVHIHGTEFSHGLAYIKSCGNDNVVVSIQGMISVISRFYTGGMTVRDIKRNITLADLAFGGIKKSVENHRVRGEVEVAYLNNVKHVIGRTSWDKVHCWALNPRCSYHFCNETLRPSFFNACWDINKICRHTIFLSSKASSLKAADMVLKALPLVLRAYPDTKIRICGNNPISNTSFKSKILLSGYNKYFSRLVEKLKLHSHVEYLGTLTEKEMVSAFLNAHVFICPSSIENSPNSLGEAQLVGTPAIGSYVGGIPDMIEHKKTGFLYRFEEVEMLANYICNIFADDNLALSLSKESRKIANQRHSPQNNTEKLLEIYKQILISN